MTNSWEDRKRTKEEEYFLKQNKEALERLKKNEKKPLLSPVTGKPLEHSTVMGINVHHCPTSGGVWLDKEELARMQKQDESPNWLADFVGTIFSKS